MGHSDGVEPDPARDERAELAHDPNEVTVQIGSVSHLDQGRGTAAAEDGQDGSDGPVFVDESGGRSRRLRRLGWILGMACAVYAVVLGATLVSGNSDAPWMPGIGKDDDKPAGKVSPSSPPDDSATPENSPAPTPTPGPSDTGGVVPGPTLSNSPTDDVTPDPDPTDGNSPDPDPTDGNSPDPDPTDDNSPDPDPTDDETDEPGPTDGPTKPTDPPADGLAAQQIALHRVAPEGAPR
ncbi:hypothetical protein [Streptomyces triticagri]|uniref:hypothetical protein n=1 Tax=Streptomyces triticagri TaxID=2293568 RepID=UPI0018F6CEB1|nr:hypothetical protein [Streptomyces triticagri]